MSKKNKNKKPGFRIPVADAIALANALIQLGAPYKDSAAALLKGDWQGAIAAFPADNKDAMSMTNLMQAIGPIVGVRTAKFFIKIVSGGKVPGFSWGAKRRITGVSI